MKQLYALGLVLLTGMFLIADSGQDTAQSKKNAPKKTALINQATCVKCGTCFKVCPKKAITKTGTGKTATYTIDPKKCLGCGTCIKKCPTKSISWATPKKTAGNSPKTSAPLVEKQKTTDPPPNQHGPDIAGH